jgi:hypothetical protein
MNYRIKRLDYILSELNETSQEFPERFNEISERLKDKSFTNKELHLILDKLKKDNNINIVTDYSSDNKEQYFITYDGVILNEKGGYTEDLTQEKLKEEKLRKQNILLDIAKYATIIAGIYYFLLILKEFLIPVLKHFFQ